MDLTLSDFKEMLLRKKGPIIGFTLLSALLLFGWGVTRDVRYRAEASFRDRAQASGIKESMSAIVFGGDKEDSEIVSGLTSCRLAEELIKSEALQLEVVRDIPLQDTVLNNMRTEWAYLAREKTPSLKAPEKWVRGASVYYPKEEYLAKEIVFLDEERFQVEEDGVGRLGEPFKGEGYSFTLEREPEALSHPFEGMRFKLKFHPLIPRIKEVRESIFAKSDVDDSTLVRVSFLHPDRKRGAYLLNQLLQAYRGFLEAERSRINEAQLGYLQQREEEMAYLFNEAMEGHAERVKGDLSASGFTDAKREMEFLSVQLLQVAEKLNLIELDEKRLSRILKEGLSPGQSDAPIVNELLQKRRELQAFQRGLKEEFDPVRYQELLEQAIKEYRGIAFPTAKELYLAFVKERQENDQFRKQLAFLLDNFESEGFEITSLTTFLADPVSHEKIMKASQLSHALKDPSNRSQKELERIREELNVEKVFLKGHLEETLRLASVKGELLDNKGELLRRALIHMAEKEESLSKKQLEDFLTARIQDLGLEKAMLQEKEEELKEKLGHMPEKWVKEEKLNYQLEQHRRLTENLASMVETKNISKNLELVQSTPLDYAYAPLHAKHPLLLLQGFLGAFLGLFFSSSYFLAKGILRDTPLTIKNLSMAGFVAKDSLKRAFGYFSPKEKIIALLNPKDNSLKSLLIASGDKVFEIEVGDFPETVFEEEGPFISPFRLSLKSLRNPGVKRLLAYLHPLFDRILIRSYLPLTDPDNELLLSVADGVIVSLNKETLADVRSLLEECKRVEGTKPVVFLK